MFTSFSITQYSNLNNKVTKSDIIFNAASGTVEISSSNINDMKDLKSYSISPGIYIISGSISTNNVDEMFCGKIFIGNVEYASAFIRGSSSAGINFHLVRLYKVSSSTTLKLKGSTSSSSGKLLGWLFSYIKLPI